MEVREANKIAMMTVKRVLEATMAGAWVLVENPLMSYLWLMDEFKALMALVGFAIVRIDQCTVGMPFRKGQLWLTSLSELVQDGAKCFHPTAHPERLVGGKTRQSAPYPERLTDIITAAFARAVEKGEKVTENTRTTARFLYDHLFGTHQQRRSDLYRKLVRARTEAIKGVRAGATAKTAEEVLEATMDAPLGDAPVIDSADTAFQEINQSKKEFDKRTVAVLQNTDNNFKDIIVALEV